MNKRRHGMASISPAFSTLSSPEPGRFRSRLAEVNEHGRVYGGQLLGQALAAAARTVPADRPATAMQFMFLAGALPEIPINYEVITSSRTAKRFSSRHVRGSQSGGRIVCDANVSFATAIDLPEHMAPPAPDCGLDTDPESLPELSDIAVPRQRRSSARSPNGFSRTSPSTSARPSSTTCCVPIRTNRACGFWIRMRRPLPDDPSLHAAAFAYLSDYWINFAACISVRPIAAAGAELYVASLNHAIWSHRPLRADEWLRSIASARAADRQGPVDRAHL